MADKAILLGINGYKSVSGLRGCENDVHNMQVVLTDVLKFDSSNIKVLLHTEVTKARVKPLMRWIYQDTQPGDRLLLHFSGHGSYTADLTGDESDQRDELICLYDMDFNNKESYFIDDELRDWTRKLPKGRQLTVVLDNCHSGTGTRKIVPPESTESMVKHPSIIVRATEERAATRGVVRSLSAAAEPDDRDLVIARFVEPPLEIRRRVEGATPRGVLRREVTHELNHVLLAGCRDDQTAADASIDGQFNGAFTFHLCKILRSPRGADLSRRDLIDKLAAALAAGHYDQVPQFEGPTDQGPLFAGKKSPDAKPQPAAEEGTPAGVSLEAPESSGPEPSPGGAGQPADAVVAASSTAQGSDLPQLMEEFLAAYNRVLAAGGALAGELAGGGLALAAAARVRPPRGRDLTRQKVLVYVHGICEHSRGFSNPWWAALSPFAPGLQPGDLGRPGETTARRHEVLWSDLVRGGARDLAAASPTRAAEHEETRQRIAEILEDRARQQAMTLAAAQPQQPGAERALETATTDRALLGIPGLDCINDFVQYLEDPSIRQQVQGRFFQVVSPLLRAGAQVEIISHSWGTVVAYESLCLLESVAPQPPGVVADLFTVGSALSIGYIKNRLIAAARDGHRPRMVRNWVNLDARGDLVGGPLRGLPFAVDQEFLNLDPVGCNSFFPSPSCAHGSYFNPQNLATNRDVFGRFIAS
jgi:hypothetical protein